MAAREAAAHNKPRRHWVISPTSTSLMRAIKKYEYANVATLVSNTFNADEKSM